MSSQRLYIYKAYERFWHGSQAALIIVMMLTGFEVHGSYALFGFETAVQVHSFAAWSLLTLWAFTIFWQFTTDEWRQYIPTLKNVDAMVRYYVVGIFKDVPHPFRKTVAKKHNPLRGWPTWPCWRSSRPSSGSPACSTCSTPNGPCWAWNGG